MLYRNIRYLTPVVFCAILWILTSVSSQATETILKIKSAPKEGGRTEWTHVHTDYDPRVDLTPHSFRVYTVEEVDSKLKVLTTRLDAQLDTQQKLIVSVRDQILARFAQLPLELTKDEKTYKLLQDRLQRDLAEVFERKAK